MRMEALWAGRPVSACPYMPLYICMGCAERRGLVKGGDVREWVMCVGMGVRGEEVTLGRRTGKGHGPYVSSWLRALCMSVL